MKKIHELDTVGHMFSASKGSHNSSVFRVSAILKAEVDPVCLQKAVDRLHGEYVHLFQKIRSGLFWHYFDDNPRPYIIEEDGNIPCKGINPKENNGYAIRILYYHHRISLEVFHVMTDGGGAIEFMKSLIYYYLLEQGKCIDTEDKVLKVEDLTEEHFYDDFVRYFSDVKIDGNRKRALSQDAYNIKGKRLNIDNTMVVSGTMDASKLNQIAKKYDTTITGFITSLMVESIYETYQKEIEHKKKPIVITIPVSLRKMFSSTSLKNFFETINVSLVPNGDMQTDDYCHEITRQLKALITLDQMKENASGNVTLASNFFAKLIPLMLKNPLIKFGFNAFGEKKKTMTISNLGNVVLPEDMEREVECFEAVLYPTRLSPVNCGIVSVNNQLVITFSRKIQDTKVIRKFFEKLSAFDEITPVIYSNGLEVHDA